MRRVVLLTSPSVPLIIVANGEECREARAASAWSVYPTEDNMSQTGAPLELSRTTWGGYWEQGEGAGMSKDVIKQLFSAEGYISVSAY